ncbi:hypothetical protein BDR07DRAFT_1411347 [Suillus spraguei]|nr:hypothetical protein BDR07DRAFT_1411347 [Suillus spraguei]
MGISSIGPSMIQNSYIPWRKGVKRLLRRLMPVTKTITCTNRELVVIDVLPCIAVIFLIHYIHLLCFISTFTCF